MTTLRSLAAAAICAFTLAISPLAALAAGDGPMVDGTITEVRPGGEFTIKHGPIPNLDMAAMTMVFKVNELKMAKGIKKGDKIKMHVEDKDGKLTIMHLKK
jgi:Cu(I)/Ag(I) efflux system protein CusF